MKKKLGFTLLELMITIAIMSVFIVLSLRMGRSAVQRASMTAAVNEFIGDFNYARQLATRKNRYVAFVFNPNGASYNICVQTRVGDDPSLETSYFVHKTKSPMNGEQCFSGTTNFAVNSVGILRAYPVDPNSLPLTVSMNFYKKKTTGVYSDYDPSLLDYQKTITIFPSGGIKVEDKKLD